MIPQTPFTVSLSNYLISLKIKLEKEIVSHVSFFDSDNELDDYVKSISYGVSKPALCFGISISQNSTEKFSYSIRLNATGGVGMISDPTLPADSTVAKYFIVNQ